MSTKTKKNTKVQANKVAAGNSVTGIDKLFFRHELFSDAFTDAVVADIETGTLHPSDIRGARKTVKLILASIERIAAALGMK